MRILRAATYRRMPWKNGGGETIEIMVSPPGASFDAFDWRLSMAHVGAPGPFSLFPGIDRTLSVIKGNGLILGFPERQPVTLDRRSVPFTFPGDVTVDSTLIDGPIDDLNVMTRRNRCHHRVARHGFTVPRRLVLGGDIGIIVAIGDTIEISADSQTVTLGPNDALMLEAGEATALTTTPQDGADLFVIEITFG